MEYRKSIQNYVYFFGKFFHNFFIDIPREICFGKICFRMVAEQQKIILPFEFAGRL